MKRITKKTKNETKDQKGAFLRVFLGTLGASLLGHMFTGKGMFRSAYGNKEWKRMSRAGSGSFI